MNRLLLPALLCGLSIPGLAQTTPYVFEVDPALSAWTWTAWANGIPITPTSTNQFQMFGTFDMRLGLNAGGFAGEGSNDGGAVTIDPEVSGSIGFLASVRVEGLLLSPTADPLDFGNPATSDGTFAADFNWRVLAGTAIITPLFGAPSYVDLTDTATMPAYTLGAITTNPNGTLHFSAPQDLRLELTDPNTGMLFVIDLLGTLTGDELRFVSSFCPGDGSGGPCPCNNLGGAGAGCANGTGSGGTLTAEGTTSLSAADLTLVATGLVPGQAGLFFQGQAQNNGGLGVNLGDGLFCAGGANVRLEVRLADGSGMASSTLDIGALGGAAAGDVRYYQIWYRDPIFTLCGHGYNLSNALEVLWIP